MKKKIRAREKRQQVVAETWLIRIINGRDRRFTEGHSREKTIEGGGLENAASYIELRFFYSEGRKARINQTTRDFTGNRLHASVKAGSRHIPFQNSARRRLPPSPRLTLPSAVHQARFDTPVAKTKARIYGRGEATQRTHAKKTKQKTRKGSNRRYIAGVARGEERGSRRQRSTRRSGIDFEH